MFCMVAHKLISTATTFESLDGYPKSDYSMIRQSDVATVGDGDIIWINGTQPVMGSQNAPPDSMFPFTRLASATVSELSLTYLYHQINGMTFAEEQFDSSTNAWIGTEYITVSES